MTTSYRPLVHRTALATAMVALLPIGVGALVTSMKAGMAFRDWPNSDGHFMLTYPWLADFLRGAMGKFVEHGHRLAGMLIGVTSILLVAVVWRCERRHWVRYLAALILACVVVQGLLGGGRVLRDDPRLAMLHGNFAAVVFCLMGAMCVVTSRRWMEADAAANAPGAALKPDAQAKDSFACASGFNTVRGFAALTVVGVYGQFILGGRQRHLHDMLYEHAAGAVLVALLAVCAAVAAFRTRERWIRRSAGMMLLVLLVQGALGAGSWGTKYGIASVGYVAQQGSPLQLAVRSAHTVAGMLLLLSSVVLVLRICRTMGAIPSLSPSLVTGELAAKGGAG